MSGWEKISIVLSEQEMEQLVDGKLVVTSDEEHLLIIRKAVRGEKIG